MSVHAQTEVYAFEGNRLVAAGPLGDAMPAVWAERSNILVFDAVTARPIDLDLRGDVHEALARLQSAPVKRPGRPKLGVTAREVTLLPRHWDWLTAQPGGASVALRKLVEAEMKSAEGPDRARRAKDATYRFITTLAGDRPGYEEATRMLFAGDWTAFDAAVAGWPEDVREAAKPAPAYGPVPPPRRHSVFPGQTASSGSTAHPPASRPRPCPHSRWPPVPESAGGLLALQR